MLHTDPVAVALVAADGVIDKMELDTARISKSDRQFLAEYQEVLAAGPTTHQLDLNFLRVLKGFFIVQPKVQSKL